MAYFVDATSWNESKQLGFYAVKGIQKELGFDLNMKTSYDLSVGPTQNETKGFVFIIFIH